MINNINDFLIYAGLLDSCDNFYFYNSTFNNLSLNAMIVLNYGNI